MEHLKDVANLAGLVRWLQNSVVAAQSAGPHNEQAARYVEDLAGILSNMNKKKYQLMDYRAFRDLLHTNVVFIDAVLSKQSNSVGLAIAEMQSRQNALAEVVEEYRAAMMKSVTSVVDKISKDFKEANIRKIIEKVKHLKENESLYNNYLAERVLENSATLRRRAFLKAAVSLPVPASLRVPKYDLSKYENAGLFQRAVNITSLFMPGGFILKGALKLAGNAIFNDMTDKFLQDHLSTTYLPAVAEYTEQYTVAITNLHTFYANRVSDLSNIASAEKSMKNLKQFGEMLHGALYRTIELMRNMAEKGYRKATQNVNSLNNQKKNIWFFRWLKKYLISRKIRKAENSRKIYFLYKEALSDGAQPDSAMLLELLLSGVTLNNDEIDSLYSAHNITATAIADDGMSQLQLEASQAEKDRGI